MFLAKYWYKCKNPDRDKELKRGCLLCEFNYTHYAAIFCRNKYDSSESHTEMKRQR